ncbi:Aminoacyl-tRNA synthetase [Chaetomium sp. MPI-SDFR-AT-0129]|nr:Aminoacyl-tRNA synthetase [Chaetomium sp. MPI-SDFR-AT-0129]
MAPGSLKKPILALNRLIGHSTAKNHMTKPHIGNIAALENDTQHERKIEKAQNQLAKKDEREHERRSFQHRRQEREERAHEEDPPEIAARYGTKTDDVLEKTQAIRIEAADRGHAGKEVCFIARVHHVRCMSSKLAFIIFRDQIELVQGVLAYREGVVSENFVRWAEHLTTEGYVLVRGVLQESPERIKGCSIHELEVRIDEMHSVVPVQEHLPVDPVTMDRVEEDEETHQMEAMASTRVRVANRIAYLRTPTAQSIFRINAAVCSIFRSVLEGKDFVEIHTPKLMPGATESGAEVFRVNYFGRTAFLAQSPQLCKQMSISADFGRVFEIGPVFRAEDSNTHRHLTEYTGLDLEMAINYDYHEAMGIIDDLLKSIFRGLYSRCRREIDTVKTRFPHEDLVWLDETPVLTFTEAVELLNSSGWTDDHGRPASEVEDLSTRAEIRIGELVKEKYKTDYYIIDKFPASARPFYTHLDAKDPRFTNSFDIFLRGQEITTGGQRIHKPELLKERMLKAGVEPSGVEEYMQGFEYGVLPHAGCGIGLERILFLLLNLGDIRNASLFPRDPKSLQEHKQSITRLPHPDADTIRYAYDYEHDYPDLQLPPVEKLIANYGDATNTSWLDDRYTVWRHEQTGAAVGYAADNGYALVMGNPLCDPHQYQPVIQAFLKHMRKREDLRPLWLLVSADIEEILGSKLGWRSLSCVAEERVSIESAKKVGKKERQAEEAGVSIHEQPVDEPVPQELRERCDKRIEDWKNNRKGSKQVHITEVRPWIDMEHRRYLWAETKDGEIAALCVLHRLSPANGYQIKFALDFPGSPSGTIEALISGAIQSLAKAGVQNVTFGAGALPEMVTGGNLDGVRARILSKTYKAIAQQLKLVQKSEFREKFGTRNDLVYICYPFMGLGVSGARTLIKFFEDEM